MSDQSTAARPFFKPLPEHDNPNTAFLLWHIANGVRASASGCWEWGGRKNDGGYGVFELGRKRHLIHRAVYKLCVGAVPDEILVCHECDNPPCCRPDHLFLGTEADNNRDCVAKGRHGSLKLTDQQVLDVRRRAATGKRGIIKALARELKVSLTTVRRVIQGDGRHHLPGPEAPAFPITAADAPSAMLAYRQRHGLSQKALGELLGFTKSYVCRVESGERVACAALLEALARLAEGGAV